MIKIKKSPFDTNEYRYLELSNRLKAVMIYNPEVESSAASMIVKVGSYSDPDNYPGLAHFLEHMLFRGSKKYPNENEYDKKLSLYSGSSNAYTSDDYTHFHYDVANDHFLETLDIFAQFFIDPLFNKDSVFREVKNVNSENSRNYNDDECRFRQLMSHISNQSHVYSKFGTGDINTLYLNHMAKRKISDNETDSIQYPSKVQKCIDDNDRQGKGVDGEDENEDDIMVDVDGDVEDPAGVTEDNVPYDETTADTIRNALIDFYKKYYSSHLMHLAIISPIPLDTIEPLIREIFSHVPLNPLIADIDEHIVHVDSINDKCTVTDNSYYLPSQMNKMVYYELIRDRAVLTMQWKMDNQKKFYKQKPVDYLSHIVGHEGEGSILNYLQKNGLATELVGGSEGERFNTFDVKIQLTKKGEQNYNDIILVVLTYMNMLKKTGPIDYIYKDCKNIHDAKFRYRASTDPTDLVMSINCASLEFLPEDLLVGHHLYEDYNPSLISSFLDQLTNSNLIVGLGTRNFDETISKAGLKLDDVENEKWYGTRYVKTEFIPIEKHTIELTGVLSLPAVNPFVAENFDMVMNNDHVKLIDDSHTELWYKGPVMEPIINQQSDDMMSAPLSYKLSSNYSRPIVNVSIVVDSIAHGRTRLEMLAAYILSNIVEKNLNMYTYDANMADLKFKISFHNNLIMAFAGYSDKMRVLIDFVLNRLVNFESQITQHAYDVAAHEVLLLSTKTTLIPSPTLDDVRRYYKEFFSKIHIKYVFHGNITIFDAISTAMSTTAKIVSRFNSEALPKSEIINRPDTRIITNDESYLIKHSILKEGTNAVRYHIQLAVNANDLRTHAMMLLLGELIGEPFFNELHTKENFGYTCHACVEREKNIMSLVFSVQAVKPIDQIVERIKRFTEEFQQHLNDNVKIKVKSMIDILVKNHESLKDEHLALCSEIKGNTYIFNRKDRYAQELRSITIEDMKKMYSTVISGKKEIVSVQGTSN
jgi:insulysin